MSATFSLDGKEIPFREGQTIIQAAQAEGKWIPHLCYHPEFKPHGSCKLCTVKVDGRHMASCTTQAAAGGEERHGFQHVGLAGSIRPGDGHRAAVEA